MLCCVALVEHCRCDGEGTVRPLQPGESLSLAASQPFAHGDGGGESSGGSDRVMASVGHEPKPTIESMSYSPNRLK